jgi:hypothetical protein
MPVPVPMPVSTPTRPLPPLPFCWFVQHPGPRLLAVPGHQHDGTCAFQPLFQRCNTHVMLDATAVDPVTHVGLRKAGVSPLAFVLFSCSGHHRLRGARAGGSSGWQRHPRRPPAVQVRYHCCAGRPTTAGLWRLSRVLAFFFSFFPPQTYTRAQGVPRYNKGLGRGRTGSLGYTGAWFGLRDAVRLVAKRVASCVPATTVLCRQLWAVPVVNPDGYAANCVIRSRWQRLIRFVSSVGLVCILLSSVVLRDLPVPGAFAHMGFPSSPSTTLLSLPLSRHDDPAPAVVLCMCLWPIVTPCCRDGGDFVWSLGPALSFG